GLESLPKATAWRCQPTVTGLSWWGLGTTVMLAQHGYSPAAVGCGPSRETSWSAAARLETPTKATPSRCPPMATAPSWVAPVTIQIGRASCRERASVAELRGRGHN